MNEIVFVVVFVCMSHSTGQKETGAPLKEEKCGMKMSAWS
jgi:hypothetical protein